MPENPGQVDTVASVGAAEQGHDEASLLAFFASLEGFVAFRGNPRMGGGFAKFESAALANQAVAAAHQHGIPADIAKSSMTAMPGGSALSMPYGGRQPPGPPLVATAAVPGQPPPPAYPPPAKRPRTFENPGQVDTVAVVGAAERGLDELALQAFFLEQPGFLTFKANPRMGGGFAKFESPALAAQCAAKAQEQQIPMEIAKTSMSSVN